jgi:hypothetical protein
MKKIVFAIIVCLLPTYVFAAPFLVCDPFVASLNVTSFQVTVDTSTPVSSTPVSNALKFDLSTISDGYHTASVKACNIWGCGESSSINFTKSVPSSPTSISIVP